MHEMFGILINFNLCIFQGTSFNHDYIVECMHTPQSMFCCLYKSVLCKYYIVYHKYYKLILSCFL